MRRSSFADDRRDVDVVLPVVDRGDREQRGDRPALDDVEVIIDQAPFDVLGAAEVRFDPPAQLREPHDLWLGQRRLLLPRRLDRLLLRPARRRGVDGKLLAGDRFVDDLAVAHLVDVRVHQAGDEGLTEAEAGLTVTFRLDVTGSAVNRMPEAPGKIICCTTTAMWTFRWSKPFRRR